MRSRIPGLVLLPLLAAPAADAQQQQSVTGGEIVKRGEYLARAGDSIRPPS